MNIGVGAVTATYVPMQAYSQQGMMAFAAPSSPASNNTNPPPSASQASSQSTSQSGQDASGLQAGNRKQAQNAQGHGAANASASVENITFQIDQQNHRIMKLNDAKGVLIYQIPSKGQLALITAQESEQKRLALVA